MSQVPVPSKWLSAYAVTDGTEAKPDADGWVTLSAATYVFVLRTSDMMCASLNIVTDGTIAWSGMTFEDTNAPRADFGQTTPGTVTDWDDSADSTWVKENTAGQGYASGAGTGWTVTALTLAKTAGKGAAMVNLQNIASARLRAKVVVTTGGKVRVAAFGKN